MPDLFDHYSHFSNKGPLFEPESAIPDKCPDHFSVRYIAYYLPQFHTIDQNDNAWGKGFTEWTNTTKALPRYVGHYQPRMPADLGFYNLNYEDSIEKQVNIARRGGIYGFCFHYYWFSGKTVLDRPLKILINNPNIDVKFCLNWANENWSRKWDGSESEIILEQKYDDGDAENLAYQLAEILKDPRYIRINGRPLIMLYRPSIVPNVGKFIESWRKVFIAAGAGNPYIIMPQAFGEDDPRVYGMDGAAGFPPHKFKEQLANHRRGLKLLDPTFVGNVKSYADLAAAAGRNQPKDFPFFPGVCPNWDNEARMPKRGLSFYGSSPKRYGAWLDKASRQAMAAIDPQERILFINAWNEWAEGAYLEPDRHYGFAYLAETRRVLDTLIGDRPSRAPAEAQAGQNPYEARRSTWNYISNRIREVGQKLMKRH